MNKQQNLFDTNRVKTVSWKFRDISAEYPEISDKLKIVKPEDMFKQFSFLFKDEVKEKFIVFWLSTNNKVTGFEVISQGTLNSSVVACREVFRGAIVATCNSIILAHNHPSGNPEPSNEDIQMTKKLCEAGKLLDIPVFDHIIFANNSYTSFVEKRII